MVTRDSNARPVAIGGCRLSMLHSLPANRRQLPPNFGSEAGPLGFDAWIRAQENGDPGAIRTHDPQLRRLVLYPAELPGHSASPFLMLLVGLA